MASMLSSSGLGGQNGEGASEANASAQTGTFGSGDDLFNPQMLLKIKEAYESMNIAGDNNVNLLLALRPHMSEKRKDKVDMAVKLIRLSKLKGLFGEFLK